MGEFRQSGPDGGGCELCFWRSEAWRPLLDREKLLADEPRAFINDFLVVLLEFESDEEIIQAKVNTL